MPRSSGSQRLSPSRGLAVGGRLERRRALALQRSLIEEALAGELEERTPELQKKGRRAKVRRKQETVRLRRRRIQASALRMLRTSRWSCAGIGPRSSQTQAMMYARRSWPNSSSLVWSRRREVASGLSQEALKEAAKATADSCPGPDGLAYTASCHAPPTMLGALAEVGRRMTEGGRSSKAMGVSVTHCVPTAEVHDEAIVAVRAPDR